MRSSPARRTLRNDITPSRLKSVGLSHQNQKGGCNHRYLMAGNTKARGKYQCTIDLLFDWFGIGCMTTDNFCFYLQSRLIQTSHTGGPWYNDTSPFSIPCLWLIYTQAAKCSTMLYRLEFCLSYSNCLSCYVKQYVQSDCFCKNIFQELFRLTCYMPFYYTVIERL
jgi:hypothetical protein